MIELPQFDSIDVDAIATLPQLNNPTAVTVSEIKKVFPQLGKILLDRDLPDSDPGKFQENRWIIAVQESLPDKTIVSRTYADLIFDDDAFDFDFITDGDEEDFGDTVFWRVIHRFTEKEFFSNNSTELQNFRIWELSCHKWQQEIIYLHEEIASIQWDRPQTERVAPDPVFGTPPMPGDPAPITGYTCPLISLPTPDPGETGYSQVFEVIDTGDPQGIKCMSWDSLPLDFIVTFDVGEALGGFFETDISEYNIYLSNTPPFFDNGNLAFVDDGYPIIALGDQNDNGSENDPIKFSLTYISLVWTDGLSGHSVPTRDEPTYVRLRRYGVENFRTSIPFERDLDPEFCHHEPETERLTQTALGTPTMYKPPDNYNFPDNFSNDGPATQLAGFGNRLGSGGSVSSNG